MDPFDRMANDLASLRVELQEAKVHNARVEQRIQALERDVEQLAASADSRYVGISRYLPVERVVYGVVGIIGTALVVALITLLLPGASP